MQASARPANPVASKASFGAMAYASSHGPEGVKIGVGTQLRRRLDQVEIQKIENETNPERWQRIWRV